MNEKKFVESATAIPFWQKNLKLEKLIVKHKSPIKYFGKRNKGKLYC